MIKFHRRSEVRVKSQLTRCGDSCIKTGSSFGKVEVFFPVAMSVNLSAAYYNIALGMETINLDHYKAGGISMVGLPDICLVYWISRRFL